MVRLDEAGPLVWGICGDLGGGKTMTAVSIAIDAIRSGYFVISNIELKLDLLRSEIGPRAHLLYRFIDMATADPWRFECGDRRGSGGRRRAIVILDEVSEYFDQYGGTAPHTRRLMSWLKHSSKRTQDVMFITQRPEYVAKSLRILITRWVMADNMALWRAPILRCKIPFASDWVKQLTMDKKGNPVDRVRWLRKSYVGRFYDTAQCISSADGDLTPYVYDVPLRPLSAPWDFYLWAVTLGLLLYLGFAKL